MDPEDRRQRAFLEHLGASEKRLGASRHSVFDALFIGIIVVVIAAGVALGLMRLRTPTRVDQPQPAAVPSVATPAPTPTDGQTKRDDRPTLERAPAPAQTEKVQRRSLPPVSTPAISQPARDERPYIDASKPGKYTIKDSKVEVEINTLSGKERDAKLEQLKKEGLLTDAEVQELKAQKG